MKNYTLPLSTYSDIKKMSYEDMAKWAADLFAKGVRAGKASVTSEEAFVASLRAVLKSTFDIGDTRAEAIIKRLGEILGGVYAREENQKSFKEE